MHFKAGIDYDGFISYNIEKRAVLRHGEERKTPYV